jgi:hypothetical protein
MIQTYAMSKASPTPLTPVIDALFQAITIAQSSQTTTKPYPTADPSYQLLLRWIEVSSYFPPTMIHAHASGTLAGPRALQMTIRRTSVWMPIGFNPDTPSHQLSMVDEMERIAFDRQRRKDYIQWARVHAAAVELGMLGVNGDSNNQLVSGRSFSEVMARDSVWQDDEVEWCAGIFILRAIIRTGLRGGPAQRQEYEDVLNAYEGRWKEIKDEARQALVTVGSYFFVSAVVLCSHKPHRKLCWVPKRTSQTSTSLYDFDVLFILYSVRFIHVLAVRRAQVTNFFKFFHYLRLQTPSAWSLFR